MSTTLTTASDKSVDYLRSLFVERFGHALPDDQIGCTQAEVSGAIKTLLREEGTIEASTESKAEVLALATDLGIQVVPGATQAAVNRQIRTLSKNVQRRRYSEGATNFQSFLDTLKPSEDEARAGF